jgi:hypothetical protein
MIYSDNLFILQMHPSLFEDHLLIQLNLTLIQDPKFLKVAIFPKFTNPKNQVDWVFPKLIPPNFLKRR